MMDLIEVRHQLHRLAEPSGEEQKTKQFILETLSFFKPHQIHTFADSNHIVAEYDFGEGPTLLFRADFDAVRIRENLDTDYNSLTQGVSHKCGHDGHSTILLGLAQKLFEHPLEKGKILLFFQAAEETGSGAAQFLHSQFLTHYHHPHVYALHNIPGEKSGTVLGKSGSFTCSVVSCDIELYGRTSHAAEPQLAICPYTAAQTITDKTLSLNQFDLSNPLYRLITLIEFQVGEKAYGVTAGTGVLRFTIRTQNDELLQETKAEIETMVREICDQEKLRYQIRWLEYFAASNNNSKAVDIVARAAKELNLPYKEMPFPFSWGEDFGLLTQQYEGTLFGLGSGEKTASLHHPDFDFPDELIDIGSNLFYHIIKTELNNPFKTENE